MFTWRVFLAIFLFLATAAPLGSHLRAEGEPAAQAADPAIGHVQESDLGGESVLGRAMRGGPIVFFVLMVLIALSVATWGIVVAKWIYLKRLDEVSAKFIKSFWDSRSLNDLNAKLGDYAYSPVR